MICYFWSVISQNNSNLTNIPDEIIYFLAPYQKWVLCKIRPQLKWIVIVWKNRSPPSCELTLIFSMENQEIMPVARTSSLEKFTSIDGSPTRLPASPARLLISSSSITRRDGYRWPCVLPYPTSHQSVASDMTFCHQMIIQHWIDVAYVA